jgi:hypothetical protein
MRRIQLFFVAAVVLGLAMGDKIYTGVFLKQ